MKKKNIWVVGLIILIVAVTTGAIVYKQVTLKKETPKEPTPPVEPLVPVKKENSSFNWKLVETVNATQQENYLISPYSIEIALNMLKEGSNGNSKEQIEKVIGTRNIADVRVKDRIGVANATFIKDKYKDYIEPTYINTLNNNYEADVILDPFTTPQKINDWANEKTNGMIPKLLDDISEEFVLGIGNALAIDVEWYHSFECISTQKETFTKQDGTKIDVEMMHETYEGDASYFKTDRGEGIILPYKEYEGKQLEFVAILPNESINSYIKSMEDEIEKIEENKRKSSEDLHIILSLPRFSYDFDLENFQEVLEKMGIVDVFDGDKADLTNIMTRENMIKNDITNLYVGEAIHKTHIDFNEKGTKAAALTYFSIMTTGAVSDPKEPEKIKIEFNKPFIYMIRDTKTKEVLFFGVTQTPNEWKGTTCDEIKDYWYN